jgi:hypothetical protein
MLRLQVKSTEIQPNDIVVSQLAGNRQVNTVEILEKVVRVGFVDGGFNQWYKGYDKSIEVLRLEAGE